jgi:hypothetical protein
MSARSGVRLHNDMQTRIALAGGNPEYIDLEVEKSMQSMEKNPIDIDDDKAASLIADALNKVKKGAKNG